MGLSLLGVVLATRLLGPSGYGNLALALAVVQLLYVLGVHWTMTAAVRFGRSALVRDGTSGSVFWSWLPVLGASALATFALAAAALPRLRGYLGEIASASWLLPALLLAVVGAKAIEHLLQAVGSMRAYAVGRPLGKAVYCLGVIVLLASPVGRGSLTALQGVILLMALGFAVQALVGLPFLGQRLVRPVRLDARLSWQIVAYSAPLLVRSAGGYLLDWVDILVLKAFRAAAEIGAYHVAYQATLVVSELLAGVTTLALPLLTAWRAEGSRAGGRVYLSRFVPQASFCWSLAVGVMGLVGALLFPLVLGASFEPTSRYFALLMTGVAFHAMAYFYIPVFGSYDALGRATGVLVTTALAKLGLVLLLVPRLGATGAAAASALSLALGAALYLVLGNRRLGVDRRLALVPPALMAPALLVVAQGAMLLHQLAALAVAAAALVLWARWARIFQRDDLELLEAIDLPTPVRRAIVWLYSSLGR